MMGVKGRDFRQLPEGLQGEALVPRDNFYRRLEERIDLSFVRELVLPLYARGGRHSIDPEEERLWELRSRKLRQRGLGRGR